MGQNHALYIDVMAACDIIMCYAYIQSWSNCICIHVYVAV